MAMIVEKKCREVIDGIEYNVTYLRGEIGTSRVYDPVRTPEQQARRDSDLKAAAASFGRAMLDQLGEEWFCAHLAEGGCTANG